MTETIEINDWIEFAGEVDAMPFRKWLFRGQSDASWALETSLYRLFDDLQKTREAAGKTTKRRPARDLYEKEMINYFKAHAHLYLNSLPTTRNSIGNLEWLSIMQHYGCPTRLLDVTCSPYTALFFAVETGHGDAAVFAFNHSEFCGIDRVSLGEDYKKDIFNNKKGERGFIIPYEPKKTHERLVAQQGAFLAPSNNYETIESMSNTYQSTGPLIKKFVIKAELRLEALKNLRRMNITAASLFPGLDGFCRSLRDQSESPSRLKRFEI